MDRIDQVLDTFTTRDAISDYARLLQREIRGLGISSDIVARSVSDDLAGQSLSVAAWRPPPKSATILHYAIGSSVNMRVARKSGRKALIYHNITPSNFFRTYDAAFAERLDAGRRDLAALGSAFDLLLADSAYNARELEVLTGRKAAVLGLVVDSAGFVREPEPAVLCRPKRGIRWLTIGRVVPNKGLFRLVEAFSQFCAIDPNAELVIVGRYDVSDLFYQDLRARVSAAGLDGRVIFPGSVTPEALAAWFETSDVYVTLSEHEGFCVPLVEAMEFGVPIVAAASTAIPETLGSAGLLVEDRATPREIAGLVAVLSSDASLRERVIAVQRERRAAFLPGASAPMLAEVVARLRS